MSQQEVDTRKREEETASESERVSGQWIEGRRGRKRGHRGGTGAAIGSDAGKRMQSEQRAFRRNNNASNKAITTFTGGEKPLSPTPMIKCRHKGTRS